MARSKIASKVVHAVDRVDGVVKSILKAGRETKEIIHELREIAKTEDQQGDSHPHDPEGTPGSGESDR